MNNHSWETKLRVGTWWAMRCYGAHGNAWSYIDAALYILRHVGIPDVLPAQAADLGAVRTPSLSNDILLMEDFAQGMENLWVQRFTAHKFREHNFLYTIHVFVKYFRGIASKILTNLIREFIVTSKRIKYNYYENKIIIYDTIY